MQPSEATIYRPVALGFAGSTDGGGAISLQSCLDSWFAVAESEKRGTAVWQGHRTDGWVGCDDARYVYSGCVNGREDLAHLVG